ncbi:MAG: mechanosensitive ion channel family protein [Bacteroidota bacterium]
MWKQLKESWGNLVDKLEGWFDALVVNLPNIVLALVVLTGAYFASRYVKKGVTKLIGRATHNETVTSVLANIITAAFLILMLFVTLSILNLDKALTSLLAGAGVIGLAVGLALQDPMINFFSGVLMSVRDYYKIGDLVKTNDYFGKIKKINLRSTIILTHDGQEVVIPNKDVLQNPLVNYSHNPRRRVDLKCGVAYGDDLRKVKDIATKAIEENIDLPNNKPVEFFYTDFGDSSINFVVRYWQNAWSQAEYLQAMSSGIIAIKEAFDAEGITIPFPITTLDFGVVGGERLDELYPLERMTGSMGNQQQAAKNNGVTADQS